jgi:hypothetical protein
MELFADDVVRQSSFVKVSRTVGAAQKFPSISMAGAFSKRSAATDAVLILRILESQYARALSSSQGRRGFLDTIAREIALKNGDCEADVIARDALICKFLNG